MAFYTRNTRSNQAARELNALRLLVDNVVGLQESAREIAAMAGTLVEGDFEEMDGGFSTRVL